ncbi:MAG: hypothetical protein M5U12_19925 [Verrucomicrobia bacterium]|nr:hypothetical protein [Verrucomicrobiota bacterium]
MTSIHISPPDSGPDPRRSHRWRYTLPAMKTHWITTAWLTGLATLHPALQAQVPFPATGLAWDTNEGDAVGATTIAFLSPSLPAHTHTLTLAATFTAQVEIRNTGTIAADYTVTYSSVRVKLESNPAGNLNPLPNPPDTAEPLWLELGPVSGTAANLSPNGAALLNLSTAGKAEASWLGTFLAGPQNFIVTWVSVTGPEIVGGKIGVIEGRAERLAGEVSAVPEPAALALISGLGLAAFAAFRPRCVGCRPRRTS